MEYSHPQIASRDSPFRPTTAAGVDQAKLEPARLTSIDAYRGFVMLLMMAEVLHLGRVSQALPDSEFFRFLAHHQSHVAWRGCSLHDLIQPSFSLLVGVALPYSIASRLARGHSLIRIAMHAAWRSTILICLGIFLRSVGKPQTNFTFEDTLTQIGLGYLPLFFLGLASQRARWAAFALVVVGYWFAFAAYPLPDVNFDYAAVGVAKDWPHLETGFAAHWNKNSNLAWKFDVWFLNLFPRQSPFIANGGGYATLSFIPTLGTMILGAIAGHWLKAGEPASRKILKLVAAGVAGIAVAMTIESLGLCPIVKRIWTPAWTLYSGGICLLMLAGFYAATDAAGYSAWSFPLRVIGANSIVAYCMDHLISGFVQSSMRTHLGKDAFRILGDAYEPLVSGTAVLVVFWLILFWMYRSRIFVRI